MVNVGKQWRWFMTRSDVGREILTQDNAATQDPIFYVREMKRTYGMDPDGDDVTRAWIRVGADCEEAGEELARELDEWSESPTWGHCSPGGAPSDMGLSKKWQRVHYIEAPVIVQPFFTRAGAERYIAENSHNLNEPEIWVGSAYRNPEWQDARKMFLERANEIFTEKDEEYQRAIGEARRAQDEDRDVREELGQ